VLLIALVITGMTVFLLRKAYSQEPNVMSKRF
jgi:hypothetical protein